MDNLYGFSAEQMLGKPTLHLPLNLIVQQVEGPKVIGVFQTDAGLPLLFGSNKTHQLILGDAFIRPAMVYESNEFRGYGLASMLREGFISQAGWVDGLLFDRKNQA